MTTQEKLDKVELELVKAQMKLGYAIKWLKDIKQTASNYDEDEYYYMRSHLVLKELEK